MSQTKGEKGIDVAMAIDILQIGLADIFDVAVLVTGDGDFVPLVRALMKQSRIVINAYFEYEEDGRKSFSNERLKDACSYIINVNALENDKEHKVHFKSFFKQLDY